MSNSTEASGPAPLTLVAGLALALAGILGLFLVAKAQDGAIAFHGYLFVAFCGLGIFWMIRRHYDDAAGSAEVEDGTR